MKIRNGFVTNSSSSSFIISMKEKDYNEICHVQDNFEDFARNYILKLIVNYYDVEILSDKNEILNFLHKKFNWDYNTEMNHIIKEEYKKYMNELKNKNVILVLNDVNHIDELYDILNDISEINDGIKFLEIRRD